jgi:hypothetical protein
MNHFEDEQFSKLIRDAVEPVGENDLERDLWPRMLQKLDGSRIRFSWFDWVLVSLALLLCLIAPEAIPGLLYNL